MIIRLNSSAKLVGRVHLLIDPDPDTVCQTQFDRLVQALQAVQATGEVFVSVCFSAHGKQHWPEQIKEDVKVLRAAGLGAAVSLSYPKSVIKGRRALPLSDVELEAAVKDQLACVLPFIQQGDELLPSVICRSALALDVAEDERTAQVVARAIYRYDSRLTLFLMAGNPGVRVAHECGIAVVQTVYAGDQDKSHVCVLANKQVIKACGIYMSGEPAPLLEQLHNIFDDERVRHVTTALRRLFNSS